MMVLAAELCAAMVFIALAVAVDRPAPRVGKSHLTE
jgi:hypothetical protein